MGVSFPVYYKGETAYIIDDEKHVTLPPVDKYLPTSKGDPPLARARKEDWNVFEGERMETNIMPGWAGSSWYFLRYMDPNNEKDFCSREMSDYWGQVDLYIGGSIWEKFVIFRFWTKFLFDRGFISIDSLLKND